MTNAPSSHELATYLGAQGVGTVGASSGWGIYTGIEPPSPDSVITLYDTGGVAPDLYEEGLRNPSIQVRVRANGYADAYSKQQEVFDVLNAIKNASIGNSRYLGVWLSSDIVTLGEDENNRTRLTANYDIKRGDAS